MEFEDWLCAQGLSPSSVKKYAGAIDGPLTKWGMEHQIISKPLRQVANREEFEVYTELIESTEIFAERNERGNHMYGAALKNFSRYLAHHGAGTSPRAAGPFSGHLDPTERDYSQSVYFEPKDQKDARQRILRDVVRRQGQPRFRSSLISAYEGRCAITQCSELAVLEAAHVTPYLGPETNSITNGLLLRADIHTLWDFGLIAIDPDSMTTSVNPALQDSDYLSLAGGRVFQPAEMASRVSHAALAQQWSIFRGHLTSIV